MLISTKYIVILNTLCVCWASADREIRVLFVLKPMKRWQAKIEKSMECDRRGRSFVSAWVFLAVPGALTAVSYHSSCLLPWPSSLSNRN